MPQIKITSPDGEPLYGTLPGGWHDTPLAAYAALASAKTLPETCQAVAQLLGLPAEPFLADVSLLLPIHRAAPWLFADGFPPDGGAPVPAFTHRGVRYQHQGGLDKIKAEQMEALLNFLHAHAGAPLRSAPHLLAVLYAPAGQPQTADVVEAAAAAFATLPVATAWPALAAFLRSSASAALSIRTALALEKELLALLSSLEAAVTTATGFTTFWQRRRAGLTRAWIKYARRTLTRS